MSKKTEFKRFNERVEYLRPKVEGIFKNLAKAEAFFSSYMLDEEVFKRKGEMPISMLDENDDDVKYFIVKDNFMDVWILANMFFLSRQKIKGIILEL